MSSESVIELEEGWRLLAAGMAKFRLAVEAHGEEARFPSNDYLQLYDTAFNMCTQKTPHDYEHHLYERYKEDVDNYNKSTVLPPLKKMQGEILLRHLVETWKRHKRLRKVAGLVFQYLGRYYVKRNTLPTIEQVTNTSFHEMVFNELKGSVTETVISTINDEREGKLAVDRDLVKDVLDIYVQIALDTYQVDFERAFLESTGNYYSNKAQTWVQEYSHSDCMLKVEDCLRKEEERAAHYLHSSTQPKIMEVVRSKLMAKNAESQTNV